MIDEAVIREAMDALAAVDPDVAKGRDLVGDPEPRIRPHGFETLLRIIVSQQISTYAAAAIMARVEEHMGDRTAESFLALNDDALRNCGLSARKVEYARGIAEAIARRQLDLPSLHVKPDTEVIKELSALKGIGVWSAEIYAMFSLGRTDIFPADDLALQEALKRLKRMRKRPTAVIARKKITKWKPWRSVGALFLWHYYKGAPQ